MMTTNGYFTLFFSTSTPKYDDNNNNKNITLFPFRTPFPIVTYIYILTYRYSSCFFILYFHHRTFFLFSLSFFASSFDFFFRQIINIIYKLLKKKKDYIYIYICMYEAYMNAPKNYKNPYTTATTTIIMTVNNIMTIIMI